MNFQYPKFGTGSPRDRLRFRGDRFESAFAADALSELRSKPMCTKRASGRFPSHKPTSGPKIAAPGPTVRAPGRERKALIIFSIPDKRIVHRSDLAGREDIPGKQVDYFS